MKFLKELYDEFPEKADRFQDKEEDGLGLDADSGEMPDDSEKDEFNFDIDTHLAGKTDDDLSFPEDELEMEPTPTVDPTPAKGKYDEFLEILIKFIQYYQNKDQGAEFPDLGDEPEVSDMPPEENSEPEMDMSQLPSEEEPSMDGEDNGLRFDPEASEDEPTDELDMDGEFAEPNEDDIYGPEEDEETPSRYPF
jgi:hypothetical protein